MNEPEILVNNNQVIVIINIEEISVSLFYLKDDAAQRLTLQPGYVSSGYGSNMMNRPTPEGLEEAKSQARSFLQTHADFNNYTIID